MGQATVDLPDPAEQPPAPVGSADDLLSQMAGEEIDRMLAEADAERGDADDTAPAEASPALDPADVDAVDVAAAEPPVEPAGTPTADAAVEAPVPAQQPPTVVAEPVELTAAPPADSTASAEPLPEAAAPVAPAADAGPDAGLPGDAEVTVDPSELNQLLATAPDPAPLPSPAAQALEQPTSAAEIAALTPAPTLAQTLDQVAQQSQRGEPTLLIRVLELVNAPLSACSQPVRDLVGKLAILTFMNAIAVLLYLILFRR